MRCEEFLSLLPMMPDAIENAQTAADFRAHAAECPECAARLAEHELLLASLQSLDDTLTLPDAFSEGWRAAVRKETASARSARLKNWRGWVTAAAAVVLVVTGTALMRGGWLFPYSGLDKQTGEFQAEPPAVQTVPFVSKFAADEPPAPMARSAAFSGDPALDGDVAFDAEVMFDVAESAEMGSGEAMESIVLHIASISLDTDQYDNDITRIDALLAQAGGWSEYWSVVGEPVAVNQETGRYAMMTFRVPMSALESFVAEVSTIGKVTVTEIVAEDISDNYYDVQGRLSMYEAQRDRLSELLAQATSMSDIIDIESRLNDVQYAIETLVGRLNHWNSRADNAVVYLSVTEVASINTRVKEGFWARVGQAFSDSFRAAGQFLSDMALFVVMALPYVAIVAGVALIVVLIVKAKQKQKGKQRSGEEE